MYMDELIKQIESRNYDWLVRSNQHLGPGIQDNPIVNGHGKYFANITKNSTFHDNYESYQAWGETALQAMINAYNKLTEKGNA